MRTLFLCLLLTVYGPHQSYQWGNQMTTHETIRLHDLQGISRRGGTDEQGNQWIEFEVDLAQQMACECSICGATIESGWLCLDGGEKVCNAHVVCE